MSKLIDAINTHRAAWQAFQDAPDGEEGTEAYKAASRAEWYESDMIDALIRTVPATTDDIDTLKTHLDWYVVEEVQRLEITPEMFALHQTITLAMSIGWQDGFLTCGEHYEAKDAPDRTKASVAHV